MSGLGRTGTEASCRQTQDSGAESLPQSPETTPAAFRTQANTATSEETAVRARRSVRSRAATSRRRTQTAAATEELLDRLITHLASLPEHTDDEDEDDFHPARSLVATQGITIPATSIAWLASQIYTDDSDRFPRSTETLTPPATEPSRSPSSLHHARLSVLTSLLPRLTHLRITGQDGLPLHGQNRPRAWFCRGACVTDDEALEELGIPPRIDLSMFPNCRVLLLYQVPSEWVYNLSSLRKTLRVLRVEKSCIECLPRMMARTTWAGANQQFHLPDSLNGHFLAPSTPLTEASPGESMLQFSRLTHVRFSHCELTDLSCSISTASPEHLLRPFARMMHITNVSLAHNFIRSQRSILRAGLANKKFLTSLDLSDNLLRSARLLATNLRHLTILNLSHNQLTHTRGLDLLASLHTLYLDHNNISDLAHMSNVSKLPLLQRLTIDGNPLQRRRPRGVRVDVWDLFREQRLHRLPPDASFRAVQHCLPLLDGALATLAELKAMRHRTFPQMERINFLTTSAGEGDDDWVRVDRYTSVRDEVMGPRGIQLRRRRRRRRGVASIVSSLDDIQSKYVAIHPFPSQSECSPAVAFSLDDVIATLSSLSTLAAAEDSQSTDEEEECKTREKSCHMPKNDQELPTTNASQEFSAENSFADLMKTQLMFHQVVGPKSESDFVDQAFPQSEIHPGLAARFSVSRDNHDAQLDESLSVANGENRNDPGLAASSTDSPKTRGALPDEPLPVADDVNVVFEPPFDTSSLSPIKQAHYNGNELKESVLTIASTKDTQEENGSATAATQPVRGDLQSTDGDELSIPHARASSPSIQESDLSSSQPSHSPFGPNFRHVPSFGGLLQEESLNISLGSPTAASVDARHQKSSLQLAEANSSYSGPGLYAPIKILENLELYFQAFVFNMDSSRSPKEETHAWSSILEEHPKIQLWSIDRRYREGVKEKAQLAGKITVKEDFRRVWQERMIACGHPALRRLTPNRAARYGFHGELLWSAANTAHLKPETIAEHRDVIVCLTDMSLYVILDHDSVTEKTKDQKRSFPLPIPRDATFEKAWWPHALAYHPLQTLTSISIGFGFQRLTLRFANTTCPVPDDFTYVLLTSNKSKTISLLKEIQSLANEAKAAAALAITDCDVLIDNDDRHVLDALSAAAAPDVFGSILHYQVLSQRWKSGDRGCVRRVCVVTDTKLYLLDEDYVGDGSESIDSSPGRVLGQTMYRVVDSTDLRQVKAVRAADADPVAITISITPSNRLLRTHNWRLVCRDGLGAERLVEDVRKAVAQASL